MNEYERLAANFVAAHAAYTAEFPIGTKGIRSGKTVSDVSAAGRALTRYLINNVLDNCSPVSDETSRALARYIVNAALDTAARMDA